MATSPVVTADATVSTPAASASSQTLFAANSRARKRIIWNNGSTILYVRLGSAAATTANATVQIAIGAAWELPGPLYCGAVTGISAGSPTGTLTLTEY